MDEREQKDRTDHLQAGTQQRGGNRRHRLWRWLLAIVLCPILLVLLLCVLVYLPPVQDWLVGIATEKISEATGKKVSVEKLRITPLLDIDLRGLLILSPQRFHDHDLQVYAADGSDRLHPDTLVYAQSCVVDLNFSSLFQGRIAVDAFDLQKARVDTQDMLDEMVLDGRLGHFAFDVHDINLRHRHLRLSQAQLDGCDLDIALRDTVVVDEDTTSTDIPWRVFFQHLKLDDTHVTFHTVRDSMRVEASVEKMRLKKGLMDLDQQLLNVQDFRLMAPRVAYDMPYTPRTASGIDASHVLLSDVETRLGVLTYDLRSGRLRTRLDQLKGKEEHSGLTLSQLSASVELDTARVHLTDVRLETPSSKLRAEVDMDWSALTPHHRGRLDASLSADFSKQDILLLAGESLPGEILDLYPDRMLTAEALLTGNIDSVELRSLRLQMPEMLDVSLSGAAGHVLDAKHLAADLHWDAQTWDVSLLQRMFGLQGFSIPALTFTGDTHIHDGRYAIEGDLAQGGGLLRLDARYDTSQDRYEALLDARQFTVTNFYPLDSVLTVTARADVKGRGTDLLSPSSSLHALVDVDRMNYGRRDVSRIHLDALMQQGRSSVNFRSANQLLDADGCIDVTVAGRKIDDAIFSIDMRGIDLYSLGITQQPLSLSMAMHMNGKTDLKKHHWLQGSVQAITVQTADTVYYPKDITTELLLEPDTLYAFLSAGDLRLHANSNLGVEEVIADAQRYWAELQRQVEEKNFDQTRLRTLLPEMDLCIESGRQNPLANIAHMMGYTYNEFDIDVHTDTLSGINGHGWIHEVNTGAIVLDTVQFQLAQGKQGMELVSRICNGRHNPDITFDARLRATLSPHDASLALVYYDDKGKKGVDLGAQATFHDRSIRLHLMPLRPILAYRYFTVNEDNYIQLDSVGRIDASLDLLADDGTGLKVYTMDNDQAEQDITVSINQLNLGELCSVLPYMPLVTGFLHGDVHLLKTDGILSVGADVMVDDMAYEGVKMGRVGFNGAYMPNEDGSHYVDGFLTQDEQEVATFTGMYQSKGETDHLDADLELLRFPLAMVNGMLGDMVQLSGYFNGGIHVEGSTSQPVVDGRIVTESMHLLSPSYSVDLRVPDDTIPVLHNRLDLSRLKAYATGSRPLQLGGYVDFADLDRIRLEVSANARNFELINAPKNRSAEAYGKVYVDLNLLVRGLLNDLSVTGNLSVLGNTDLTYVLKDSPITIDDEMADLVTFVDFSDTVTVEKPQPATPSNLNMRLGINIDQSALLHVLLSEDGANYANIEGGGNLTLTYDERRGLQLHGRYTILQGRMNYTLMVVTLKDCDIASGSYVDFNGDPFNPRLSISASERLNTTITENQTPRSVAFDVGLNVSQTLDNMGLEFTLEAPEDMNLQNEIAQMTAEQRGRVAVTLMATGMYIVEGKSTGGFNTTNALNSFLNSQISQITGKALNTVDLSLGVQNTNTATGSITTDYSFRFAKRFWGNRISLIVGGKVSSGSEAENTGLTLIDNVSIEYRLDESATRYVTVYYDNSYESILEGRVAEMGAGLVLRRKTTKLGELFLFRKKEDKTDKALKPKK